MNKFVMQYWFDREEIRDGKTERTAEICGW